MVEPKAGLYRMKPILLTSAIWLLSAAAWGQSYDVITEDSDTAFWHNHLIDTTVVVGDTSNIVEPMIYEDTTVLPPHPKAVELLHPITIFYVDTVGWETGWRKFWVCDTSRFASHNYRGWSENCCCTGAHWDSTIVPSIILDTVIIVTLWIDADREHIKKWRVRQ